MAADAEFTVTRPVLVCRGERCEENGIAGRLCHHAAAPLPVDRDGTDVGGGIMALRAGGGRIRRVDRSDLGSGEGEEDRPRVTHAARTEKCEQEAEEYNPADRPHVHMASSLPSTMF